MRNSINHRIKAFHSDAMRCIVQSSSLSSAIVISCSKVNRDRQLGGGAKDQSSLRPTWVEDVSASSCKHCSKAFNITVRRVRRVGRVGWARPVVNSPGPYSPSNMWFRRDSDFRVQHHCRHCGQVFCSKCCSKKTSTSIVKFNYHEAVRVCKPCHKLCTNAGDCTRCY